MILVLAILLLSLVEYFGDSNFLKYARSGDKTNLILGIIFYGLVIKFLIKVLKSSNLIYANGMWDGISTIVASVLAFYLLHERLSNPIQWVGLFMVTVGIIALHHGDIPK